MGYLSLFNLVTRQNLTVTRITSGGQFNRSTHVKIKDSSNNFEYLLSELYF